MAYTGVVEMALDRGATVAVPGPRVVRRVPDGWEDRPYERLKVRGLSPTIGAEIGEVDLASVDDELFRELHRCLLEWKVLFFRDQRIGPDEHRAFASRWGELEEHPFIQAGDTPDVVRFEKGDRAKGYENLWHTDVTWRECPALGAVLRAIEVPEVGGDTLFADMGAAYDNLPDALRARVDGLQAVHDFTPSFGALLDAKNRAEMQARFPAVSHPVVRTHPETGRRTLFVNAIFTTHIVGLEPAESRELLALLCRQAAVPEYQCRWRWRAGDVAMWDNRAVQHYACSDYAPARRVMERVAIVGDRPE
jgi:taurine dioxygenase